MSIRVVELFAGVGGFRIGLEGYPKKKRSAYDVVWSNQWEPSTKKQHASLVYQARWPKCVHVNKNIEEVIEEDFKSIPEHDLLVGGFPCQDYSVATSLKNSKGLRGKKGVLWWSIEAILRKQGKKAPKYLMLENVDRLLLSPASQRGRDFAIMLSSLNALGYAVEWRVINAGEYGMPQRRKRVFIFAYKKGTETYRDIRQCTSAKEWIVKEGLFARTFPCSSYDAHVGEGKIEADIAKISSDFNLTGLKSPFLNSGMMINGAYTTLRIKSRYRGKSKTLGDMLLPLDEIPEEFMISKQDIERKSGWRYQKGAKRIARVNASGHRYVFSEGSMTFPDVLGRPSRTIITGEGGKAPSRFKHVIKQDGKYRRLTPIELERLNMFPDNHTALDGVSDAKRAFFMGNALVVGVIEKLGKELAKRMNSK
jgi:DNA (cytosine-5)-methyltransferase 1